MTTTELIARLRAARICTDGKRRQPRRHERLAADALEELSAEVEMLRDAARNIEPYLMWAISPESPGHHPTMRSAVHEFCAALEKRHD